MALKIDSLSQFHCCENSAHLSLSQHWTGFKSSGNMARAETSVSSSSHGPWKLLSAPTHARTLVYHTCCCNNGWSHRLCFFYTVLWLACGECVSAFIYCIKQRRQCRVQLCDKLKEILLALLCCRAILLSRFGSACSSGLLHDSSVVICCFVDVAVCPLHERSQTMLTHYGLLPREISDKASLIP